MTGELREDEQLRPLPHLRTEQGVLGRVRRQARLFADLQVSTVDASVRPWLSQRSGHLLEVGCGDQPYRSLVPADCKYVGLDIEQAFDGCDPEVVRFDGKRFPFRSAAFDSVFHTEVLEHVFETRRFLAECSRVLKPGGSMMFSVPFQARFHYIPDDYFRFTPSAISQLLAEAGFGEIAISSRGTDVTVAAYKVVSVFYRWALGGLLHKLLFMLFSPVVVVALLVAHLSIRQGLGSPDDCLGYTVSAVRRDLSSQSVEATDGPVHKCSA